MKHVVLVLFASGCIFAEAEPVPLAELPDLHVELQGGPDHLRVSLHASEAAEPDVCWRFARGFSATVAGRPLTIVDPGTFDGEDCFEPILDLVDPDPTPDATLVLEDDSKSIAVPLGEMFVPRTAQLSPPGPWSFSSGQHVYATLSPQDAQARLLVFVDFVPASGAELTLSTGPVGDLVSFTMPASTTSQQAHLELTLIEWPLKVPCGAAVCQRTQRQSWLQEITLSP
jgi:hypothetical protein